MVLLLCPIIRLCIFYQNDFLGQSSGDSISGGKDDPTLSLGLPLFGVSFNHGQEESYLLNCQFHIIFSLVHNMYLINFPSVYLNAEIRSFVMYHTQTLHARIARCVLARKSMTVKVHCLVEALLLLNFFS